MMHHLCVNQDKIARATIVHLINAIKIVIALMIGKHALINNVLIDAHCSDALPANLGNVLIRSLMEDVSQIKIAVMSGVVWASNVWMNVSE